MGLADYFGWFELAVEILKLVLNWIRNHEETTAATKALNNFLHNPDGPNTVAQLLSDLDGDPSTTQLASEVREFIVTARTARDLPDHPHYV